MGDGPIMVTSAVLPGISAWHEGVGTGSVIQSRAMDIHSDGYVERAKRLHGRVAVVDTHCDTTGRLVDPDWDFGQRHEVGHVDIPRLLEGGVAALFFAVWVPGPVEPGAGLAAAREQLARIQATISRHSDHMVPARTADDVRRAHVENRIAGLIGIEGGYLIEDSLENLREYHARGASYLTLTHGFHTSWADSSGLAEALSPQHGGLTDFGREVVRELNRLGMMVDVSHVHDLTVRDVLETSAAPIIASHSSCRAVAAHQRNLSDALMREIAATGGVVQINFCAGFIDPAFPKLELADYQAYEEAKKRDEKARLTDHQTPLEVLVDHFDHALQVIGPDHVGIGSDFDGVPMLPVGLEDCSKLPYLTAGLLRRGYSESQLTGVLGGNVLRVMEECQAVAGRVT